MSKVTSKLQVTIPKVIADQYGIQPGDDVTFVAAGDVIRLIPGGEATNPPDTAKRLDAFDQATRRQTKRQGRRPRGQRRPGSSAGRGWTRAELYDRGSTR